MTDKKVSLRWYYYVLLTVVALSALSMTWWSMYDLSVHQLSAPIVLSMIVSLIFDLGGTYLILLSIEYAKTEDSGFWTELGAYAFIATSTYIVSQHAILNAYPTVGIVLFASAPVILAILLNATLRFLTRQQRRATGRVTEKLPSVGWLTWVRYAPQAWKLTSVAMQSRLINAADKLEIAKDKHGIFGQPETVHVPSVQGAETIVEKTEPIVLEDVQDTEKTIQQLPQRDLAVLTSSDKMSLPAWLPHEPTMTLGKLVRTAMDNGEDNIETIYRYALTLKGDNVNKLSLSRTLSREKAKMNG